MFKLNHAYTHTHTHSNTTVSWNECFWNIHSFINSTAQPTKLLPTTTAPMTYLKCTVKFWWEIKYSIIMVSGLYWRPDGRFTLQELAATFWYPKRATCELTDSGVGPTTLQLKYKCSNATLKQQVQIWVVFFSFLIWPKQLSYVIRNLIHFGWFSKTTSVSTVTSHFIWLFYNWSEAGVTTVGQSREHQENPGIKKGERTRWLALWTCGSDRKAGISGLQAGELSVTASATGRGAALQLMAKQWR